MNTLQPLSFLWKIPKGKINPNTFGYMHPTGEISFASSESALNYAKNKVISALNYEKGKEPFERGILVHDNVILKQKDGGAGSVTIIPDERHRLLNYVVVHGHPDEGMSKIEKCVRKIISFFIPHYKTNYKPKECVSFPVSFGDYTSLINNPHETKVIAYNSKGEFSSLAKTKDSSNVDYGDLKYIENEYGMEVPNGYLYQFSNFVKSFVKSFLSIEKSEQKTINAAKLRRKLISEFWDNNAENLCKVKYETGCKFD